MTRPERLLSAVLTLTAALTLAVGCGGDDEARPDLIFNNGPEVHSLDPHVISWRHDVRISHALFEGLMTSVIDPPAEGEALGRIRTVPGAAESVDVSDDGTVYTFHIRPDAKWSNGEPVTAEQFRWSWQRVLTPATAADYVGMLYVIDGAQEYYEALVAGEPASFDDVGVKVIDERTLEVTLRAPTGYFVELTAFPTFFPVYRPLLERFALEGNASDGIGRFGRGWMEPGVLVGNGPYVLAEHDFKQRMLLHRNEHYWDRANVALETIEALAIEENAAGYNAYESGGSRIQDGLPDGVARSIMELPPEDRPAGFRGVPALATYYYRFNCTPTADGQPNPLADPNVRRALVMAVDRAEIPAEVTGIDEPVATSFVPPTLTVVSSDGETVRYQPPASSLPFDPHGARELLAAAGYPGGEGLGEIRLMYNVGNRHQPIAEAVARMWATNLGVEVVLDGRDTSAFGQASKAEQKQWHVARSGWFADYQDPSTFLEMFYSTDGNNDCGYVNAEVDRLISAAAVEPDQRRRMDLYRQAEDIIVNQEAAILPLFHYVDLFMIDPSLQGAYPNVLGRIMLRQLSVEP